jgi:competence protein ComEA
MARRFPIRLLSSFFCRLDLCLVSGRGEEKTPAKPVNLNTANSQELQQAPGIASFDGADKILQMRNSYGAFSSVDDLLAIRGLGPKRLEKMRKYLTVGKPAPKSNAFPKQMPSKQPRASPEQALSAEQSSRHTLRSRDS